MVIDWFLLSFTWGCVLGGSVLAGFFFSFVGSFLSWCMSPESKTAGRGEEVVGVGGILERYHFLCVFGLWGFHSFPVCVLYPIFGSKLHRFKHYLIVSISIQTS